MAGRTTGGAEEQVVDEPERGRALLGVEGLQFGHDALGRSGADLHIRVGGDGSAAEPAVVRAAARPDDVRLDPSVAGGVGVLREEHAVDERQGVDVGGQVAAGVGAAGDARRGGAEQRVAPHHPGELGAAAGVAEQGGDAGLALAED